jgi:hypothetical protein
MNPIGRREPQMKLERKGVWSRVIALVISSIWAQAVLGQTFSSGGTGADGPLTVSGTVNITVRPGGVYNYTTVTLNTSSTLNFVAGEDNSPVIILATGDVTIGAGAAISVNGNGGTSSSVVPPIGGVGGPGSFAGGDGGVNSNLGSGGRGPGGGQPAAVIPGTDQAGKFGAPDAFVSLIPLFGGSGGAGGGGTAAVSSGGGGGGAILIASSTRISFLATNSTIRANGGTGATPANFNNCTTSASGPGSGGALRLVAPEIVGPGQLRAIGGTACNTGAPGGDGRIRLEATNMGFTGSAVPVASVSLTPGPVSPLGDPVLVNVPTLAITSIGGQALPSTTGGSYFAPDITLPLGTTNPVPVAVAATNTPVGAPTAISVRLIPQAGGWTDVPVTNQTGSFASSSGSADVTFLVGRVSVVQAIAAFELTGQTASLFPLIDGDPVHRVMFAALPGAPSTVSLVTRSGKELRLDQLGAEDRIKVALAWAALKEARN